MKRIYQLFILVVMLLIAGCRGEAVSIIPGSPDQTGNNQDNPPTIDVIPLELVDAYPGLSFRQPVVFLHPGDGSNRIFVVEKAGRIYTFENSPQTSSASLFLDISDRVDSSASEKGLLGLAFHPNFAENGLFFVNYTNRTETVVAGYQATKQHPQVGLPGSEKILMTIPQPFANHNGGCLAFGPDGLLYIATGDGVRAETRRAMPRTWAACWGRFCALMLIILYRGWHTGSRQTTRWLGIPVAIGRRYMPMACAIPGSSALTATEIFGRLMWDKILWKKSISS